MTNEISTYISKQASKQQNVLTQTRNLIKTLLPKAEERMSYGVPSFRLNGKSIMYAAFKAHLGLYPDPTVINHFQKELVAYETAKGTIKFNLDQPIPFDLITKIVKYKYSL